MTDHSAFRSPQRLPKIPCPPQCAAGPPGGVPLPQVQEVDGQPRSVSGRLLSDESRRERGSIAYELAWDRSPVFRTLRLLDRERAPVVALGLSGHGRLDAHGALVMITVPPGIDLTVDGLSLDLMLAFERNEADFGNVLNVDMPRTGLHLVATLRDYGLIDHEPQLSLTWQGDGAVIRIDEQTISDEGWREVELHLHAPLLDRLVRREQA